MKQHKTGPTRTRNLSSRPEMGRLSFLIVDDMPAIRKMLRQMLSLMGVNGLIREAGDGVEALEKLQGTIFDFIICDINMPHMDGLELLKVLRESKDYHDTPFLMITGEVSEEIVAAAAESEVDNYLLKPFTIVTLEGRILEIIQKKQNPSPGELIFQQANQYKNNQQYDRAIQEALKLCRPPYKKQAKVLNLIAECHLEKGDLSQADKFLTAAMEHNPRYPKTYNNYASLKEQTGELDEAIKALQTAHQFNPHNRDRLLQLGKLLMKSGETEKAKEYVEQALKVGTDVTRSHQKEAAELFLQSGLAAEATDLFIQSIKDEPGNLYLYNRLGIALRRQQKHQEALDWYYKALKIDPNSEMIYFNIGILYFDLDEKNKAREAFEAALRIRPNFSEAKQFVQRYLS